MTNITTFKLEFKSGNILAASELNAILYKVNLIIDGLKSVEDKLEHYTTPVTQNDITNTVTVAIEQLRSKINLAISELNDRLDDIDKADDGSTDYSDEETWLRLFKKTFLIESSDFNTAYSVMNAVLQQMNVLDDNGNPVWNVTVTLKIQQLDDAYLLLSSLVEALPDALNLLVVEKNGEKVINTAALILAINNSESTVGISADKIILDGNVVLPSALANYIKVSLLNTILADILNAVINQIEAGDVNVTGTLTYNKIIGNVSTISTSQVLSDNLYFVIFDGQYTANVNQYPTITLPTDPTTGLTIFISCGSRCFNLLANKQIKYYYKYDTGIEGIGEYELREGSVQQDNSINVFNADWSGVVLFIYTGSYWQQLIHNIKL